MKDYYDVLGITRNADEMQIKKAYRQLAHRFHPDRNRAANAGEIFQEINEAYEVLGEPGRKADYDNRLRIALAELIIPEPAARHRDPAYRRKRSNGMARPVSVQSDIYDLMKRYLLYARIFNAMGFALSLLFFLDYTLPYQSHTEAVSDVVRVSTRRNSTAYFIVKTETGREVKIYAEEIGVTAGEPNLIIETTPVFATPMSVQVEYGSGYARLAYLYRYMFFFPLGLLISSLVGIIFRSRTEVCFNTGVTSFVLLLITLTLLL